MASVILLEVLWQGNGGWLVMDWALRRKVRQRKRLSVLAIRPEKPEAVTASADAPWLALARHTLPSRKVRQCDRQSRAEKSGAEKWKDENTAGRESSEIIAV